MAKKKVVKENMQITDTSISDGSVNDTSINQKTVKPKRHTSKKENIEKENIQIDNSVIDTKSENKTDNKLNENIYAKKSKAELITLLIQSNEKIESYQKQLSDLGTHLNNGKILLQKAANEISVLRKDNALLNTALQKYNSLTLVDICKSWDNCINPHYDCNNCPLAGTENPFIKHNFLSGNLSVKNLTTKL